MKKIKQIFKGEERKKYK